MDQSVWISWLNKKTTKSVGCCSSRCFSRKVEELFVWQEHSHSEHIIYNKDLWVQTISLIEDGHVVIFTITMLMESYLWSNQVAHWVLYKFRWAHDVSVLLSSCRIRSYNSLRNEVTWVGVPTKTTHLFAGDHNVCFLRHILSSNSCN